MSKAPSLESLYPPKGAAAPTATNVPAAPPAGPKGLTIKVDSDRYRRLRLLAVDTGKTHQAIMVEALDAYLAALGR